MANKNFTVKNGLEVGGQEVISSSGAITSAALGGQVLGTSASPSFDNLTLAGALRGPETFVIDPAAIGDNTGTVVIAGDLQVDGTTTTINSTTMEVDDLNITLASGAANASAANGAGITVDIAGATNPSLVYGSSNDDWTFNKNLNVTGNGALSGNLDVVGQIGAYDNPGSAWGKMILRATDFEFKNAGGTIIGSFDTNNHLRIVNDLQMDSTSPRLDYDNGDSSGSFRLFSTSSNAATHQFYPNGHAHFITTAGTFKVEGLGGSSNQIESSGSLKVRAVSGSVDLLNGLTEVLNTTATGVTLPLNLVVNGKLGINENSLSSNARLQVRYDNAQSYSAYNALTNPSMIIKNLTSGASKFASLGFITEANGEGAISLVQGSGNINADMTFSVRSSGTRAEHMRITHDGNVGIGTSSPAFTAVSGSTNQIGLEIQNGNNDSSAHLKLTGRNNTGSPGVATSFEIMHLGDSLKTSMYHGGTEAISINSASDVTIHGVGNGLYFNSGSNQRIYFNTHRALEGSSDGAILQVGEGYTKILNQGYMVTKVTGSNIYNFEVSAIFTATGSSVTRHEINLNTLIGASTAGTLGYTVHVVGYGSGGTNGVNYTYTVGGYSGHDYSGTNYNGFGAGTIQNGYNSSNSTSYDAQGISYHPCKNLGAYMSNGEVYAYVPGPQRYGVTISNNSTSFGCVITIRGMYTG